jgi:hypothetical protein
MARQRGTAVVTQRESFSRILLVVISAASLLAATANGAVTTGVDRAIVDLNESFVLKIVIDTAIDLDPDLSVLDENFLRGQASNLTNTSILNGQIRRSRTLSVPLMAKATGVQEIPSITVGSERSKAIVITVNEPAIVPPGKADVFVTSEVDQTETYVQAQILYRIKVYRAVATRQPSLREPTISGAESLLELVGDERSYDSLLNGRAYKVVERVIAIYPQESGEIAISPARFEARVLRDGRITGRKVFESGTHTINILPAPAPPAEFPAASWLPAHDVQLHEQWSREPHEIKAGEPVTRHVTISALGQLETQLPALEPPVVEGMNIYSDKPDLSRRVEVNGIRGIRKDQYAMIGVRGGSVDFPELAVPWWDLAAGEWRVARLPAREINIDAANIAAGTVVAEAPDSDAELPMSADVSSSVDNYWQKVSQLLAAVLLLTIVAWWWSTRKVPTVERQPEPPPVYKQQAKYLKAARKAANAGDKNGVRQALIEWGRLQWPVASPRSIGDLAGRVTAPLSEQLRRLSAVSYGNADLDWDGAALATALRSIHALEEQQVTTGDTLLPPLMPPRA